MLVFAGISPHPPILIPSIGKGNLKKINKTKLALEKMEEDLYTSHPDIILIISPHGSYFSDAFTMNSAPEFSIDLKEFGDLATKMTFKGDMDLTYHIRDATKHEYVPAVMISEPVIDHGSAVPLYYLARHLPNVKLLQIGFCELDNKTHFNFGRMIKEEVTKTNKRVAVIASGDLSHALTTNAPAGFNPRGKEFDEKIRELFMSKNLTGLSQIDESLIEAAAQCGYRSFLILAGILHGIGYEYRELSYEAPFGVGYLTAEFEL